MVHALRGAAKLTRTGRRLGYRRPRRHGVTNDEPPEPPAWLGPCSRADSRRSRRCPRAGPAQRPLPIGTVRVQRFRSGAPRRPRRQQPLVPEPGCARRWRDHRTPRPGVRRRRAHGFRQIPAQRRRADVRAVAVGEPRPLPVVRSGAVTTRRRADGRPPRRADDRPPFRTRRQQWPAQRSGAGDRQRPRRPTPGYAGPPHRLRRQRLRRQCFCRQCFCRQCVGRRCAGRECLGRWAERSRVGTAARPRRRRR